MVVRESMRDEIVTLAVTVTVPARFGLEGREFGGDLEPELTTQAVEHVVVQIQKASALDAERNVTVAEVIGGAHQELQISGSSDRYVLGRGADARDPALPARAQPITVFQSRPAREHDAHHLTARERYPRTCAPALMVIERDDQLGFGCVLGRQ
jgi:hypothetical protein